MFLEICLATILSVNLLFLLHSLARNTVYICIYLPDKVLKVHGDGTFDVEYEDGELIQHDTDPSMRKQAPRHRSRISVPSDSSSVNLNKSRNDLPRRPRGRNPKGVKWDYKIGQWVKNQSLLSKVKRDFTPFFATSCFELL